MSPGTVALLVGLVKDAFTKENVKSPTTVIGAAGVAASGYGLTTFSSKEEVIASAVGMGFSVAMFFFNEWKEKQK